MDERMNALLLDEMRAIEAHRTRHLREHPGLRIDREDPELRLILEALAFSAARTRLTTTQGQEALWQRIFRSEFDYLLRAQPAMAMLRAEVTPGLIEALTLPRGSAFLLTRPDGQAGDFETLCDLSVLPVALKSVDLLPMRRGYRLVLSFESSFQRSDAPGVVRIYLDYLDDYLTSLRVQYQLRLHTQRAFVVYDQPATASSDGPTCALAFGSEGFYDAETANPDVRNPIERVRDFLHFPQADLFVHFHTPGPAHPYTRFALCVDLDSDYRPDPPLFRDLFVPYAVPLRNTRRDFSRPVRCDGTRDSYPILHVLGDRSRALLRTLAVYDLLPSGMAPIPPAGLATSGDSFEIEERVLFDELGDSLRGHVLYPRLADALLQSRQLVVDGLWHQPAFGSVPGRLQALPADRSYPGLSFRVLGPLRPTQNSPLDGDPAALLELLALKMRPVLDLAQLLRLLSALGGLERTRYHEVAGHLIGLRSSVTKDGSARDLGIRHEYHIQLAPYPEEQEPLVWRLLVLVGELLDAWNHDASIALYVDTSGSSLRLPLPNAASVRTGGPVSRSLRGAL